MRFKVGDRVVLTKLAYRYYTEGWCDKWWGVVSEVIAVKEGNYCICHDFAGMADGTIELAKNHYLKKYARIRDNQTS